MLGFYENFPQTIHLTETFTSLLQTKSLQQQFILVFQDLNRKDLSFEEVGNPTVPGGTVIFEFGIADAQNFCYLDKEEIQKALAAIERGALKILDLFCIIRYYKGTKPKKAPLKFDYFMTRLTFGKDNTVEFQVFHERGPRYLGPADIVAFIVRKVNEATSRKILKPLQSP